MKKVLKKVMALTLAAVLTIGTAVTSTAAAPSPTTGKEPVNQIADTDSKGNNTKSPVYTVRTYDTGRARIIGAATIKKNVTVPNYVKVNGVKYRVTSIGAKSLKNWKSVKKVSSLQKSEKYLPGRITWSNVPTGFSEETAGLMISVMVDWIMLYQQERI